MIKITLYIFMTISTFACSQEQSNYPVNDVKEIKLPDHLINPQMEMSGLAWYKNNLVLLPQLERTFNGHKKLYTISKTNILYHLSDPSYQIKVDELAIIDAGIENIIPSPEYEAIEFKGKQVFLLMESDINGMKSFVVKGSLLENGDFKLDLASISEVPIKYDYFEIAGESILIKDNKVFVIYEGNGKNINASPKTYVYDLELNYLGAESFPTIEYRVTDSTSIDPDNKFWLINSFYPLEENKLKPVADLFKPSVFESREFGVKRLIEMEFSGDSIQVTKRKPIMLYWEDWNWEGLVRLDDLGFLIVNDTYAFGKDRTCLGFVSINPG